MKLIDHNLKKLTPTIWKLELMRIIYSNQFKKRKIVTFLKTKDRKSDITNLLT